MKSELRRAVYAVVKSDYNVLQITEPDGEDLFMIVTSFQENYKDSQQTIEFCEARGVDITDFLTKNLVNMTSNEKQFFSALSTFLETAPKLRISFNPATTAWKKICSYN